MGAAPHVDSDKTRNRFPRDKDESRRTSKACSGCGCLKDDLSLSDRVYRCGHCGVEIDRDLNAAINIHTAGLAEIHACGQDGAGRGESRDETGLDEAGTKPRANSRSLTN